MGRIFRKCESRLQWILTCIKRQKITGTMKTVYLVCLVAAGAAFAFAADHCNRNDGGCVPVITDPDPVNPPTPISLFLHAMATNSPSTNMMRPRTNTSASTSMAPKSPNPSLANQEKGKRKLVSLFSLICQRQLRQKDQVNFPV